MKPRLNSALAAILAAAGAKAIGAGVAIEPGQWETTVTTHMSMLAQPQTKTSSDCIRLSEIDPMQMMSGNNQCTLTDQTIEGNTVRWRMSCKTDGGEALGDGEFTSAGSSAQGKMRMQMKAGNMSISMDTEWQGKRVGSCS